MTVNSYLNDLARRLIVRDSEKDFIRRSFIALESRLSNYFLGDIGFVSKFGSYHRGTILSRRYDFNSDVDILVKFMNASYKPQTYPNKLKQFVEYRYSSSVIRQSYPAIVLMLNHIKFELVPCIEAELHESGNFKIPSKVSDYQGWLLTSPFEFNKRLIRKNKVFDYRIKPLIRILKRWNVKHPSYPKIYDSFELEEQIINHDFSRLNFNLKDCLFDFVNNMSEYYLPGYKKREVKKLVDGIKEIQYYENRHPIWAEEELRKFFD